LFAIFVIAALLLFEGLALTFLLRPTLLLRHFSMRRRQIRQRTV
jgi:hypothetical protein